MNAGDGVHVETFDPGPYATNCYLVRRDGRDGCFVVDAGFEPTRMIERARELGGVEALVLTHAHVDHIAGVNDLRRAWRDLPVWIHEAERDWLGDPELNLSAFSGTPVSCAGATRLLRDGEMVELLGLAWEVRHTPGHSPGGIALWRREAGIAFVGDALFAGSIGRTDFPGCSFEELETSIRAKLYTMPDETRILPGHGPASTIGREKKSNPFVGA